MPFSAISMLLSVASVSLIFFGIATASEDLYTLSKDNSRLEIGLENVNTYKLKFKTPLQSGTILTVQLSDATTLDLTLTAKGILLKSTQKNEKPKTVGFVLPAGDMKWHDLTLSCKEGGIDVSLDNLMTTFLLRKDALGKQVHLDRIFIGKQDRTKFAESEHSRFIGCVSLEQKPENFVAKTLTVRKGCFDACQFQSCYNGGVCENRITTAVCRCQGTGYEGPNCQQASLAISLDEHSVIALDMSRNPVLVMDDILQTRLRTRHGQGLLLHSRFKRGHILLALINGSIQIDIALDHRKLFGTTHGPKINDGQWHFIQFRLINKHIVASIDNQVAWRRKWDKRHPLGNTPREIDVTGGEEILYFGGGGTSDMPAKAQMRNFVGDIQQTILNGLDVIRKALFEDDWRLTHTGSLPSHVITA